MTPAEFAAQMKILAENEAKGTLDTEAAHVEMDKLMCEALTALGYEEGVGIFNAVGKWCA